jgi:hypothetical protein
MYVCMHVCMYVCIYVWHVRTCRCFLRIRVHVVLRTYIHIYIYVYVGTYIQHVYMYMHSLFSILALACFRPFGHSWYTKECFCIALCVAAYLHAYTRVFTCKHIPAHFIAANFRGPSILDMQSVTTVSFNDLQQVGNTELPCASHLCTWVCSVYVHIHTGAYTNMCAYVYIYA